MRVVLSREARDDLERIGDHIAQDSPQRARSFVRELTEAASGIGQSPHAFQQVARYREMGIRRRVHGNYLIFFRIELERVVVIHILHGAQDVEGLLFPEP
ncbi:type II toxin-antitoxin system RelE/ParE family toxin [Brevundimonas sp.]|uniref:type II toxin-antitoxin system RelE/ParE family toxin n=1 Tax=Brevundimonas sp. TaxID=1871086 RepID=UPI002AB98EAA|nr:type II toxin-antitoxin system RelE/ParE family toxin [Brevundimonas sp.]MDZ4362628.1 type II toxin-antitoxin system RelE/ParE family toxin [Brevundimonas sp.]